MKIPGKPQPYQKDAILDWLKIKPNSLPSKMSDSTTLKFKRDFPLERFIDSMILSRAYFGQDGRLRVEALIADALLICHMIYGERGTHTASSTATDVRHHDFQRRDAVTIETVSPRPDHDPV
jgi:hypothetical protein